MAQEEALTAIKNDAARRGAVAYKNETVLVTFYFKAWVEANGTYGFREEFWYPDRRGGYIRSKQTGNTLLELPYKTQPLFGYS